LTRLSLFKGPNARARKYASEELIEWWTANPRPPSRAEWLKAAKDKKTE
jgi:hypothetical protein